MKASAPALRIDGLSKRFGGVAALQDLSVVINSEAVSAIIGPNGAGKTTVFNVVTGYLRPDAGRVTYGDVDLRRMRPHQTVRHGISRTFQELRLFESLSVLDNILLAARSTEHAVEVVDWLQLGGIVEERVSSLGYAEQKVVALGRALAPRPQVLLLDEPTSGLDRRSVDRMLELLQSLRDRGISICMIEHNLEIVRLLDPHLICMHLGGLFAEGSFEDLAARDDVREIFFG